MLWAWAWLVNWGPSEVLCQCSILSQSGASHHLPGLSAKSSARTFNRAPSRSSLSTPPPHPFLSLYGNGLRRIERVGPRSFPLIQEVALSSSPQGTHTAAASRDWRGPILPYLCTIPSLACLGLCSWGSQEALKLLKLLDEQPVCIPLRPKKSGAPQHPHPPNTPFTSSPGFFVFVFLNKTFRKVQESL